MNFPKKMCISLIVLRKNSGFSFRLGSWCGLYMGVIPVPERKGEQKGTTLGFGLGLSVVNSRQVVVHLLEKETGCDEKTDEPIPGQTPKREERGTPLPGASRCSQPRPWHLGFPWHFWLPPVHIQVNTHCQPEESFLSLFYQYVPFYL